MRTIGEEIRKEVDTEKERFGQLIADVLESRKITNNRFAISILVPVLFPLLRDDWEKTAKQIMKEKKESPNFGHPKT